MPRIFSTPPVYLRPGRDPWPVPAIGLALCLALLGGCEGDPDAPGTVVLPTADGSVAVDAMPDATADAMPDTMQDATADAMQDAIPDVGCAPDCPALEWREGPALGRVSDHHTTLILGDDIGAALYVIGGIETDARGGIAAITGEIRQAKLGDDGMPAPFTAYGQLPFALAFHGQAVAPETVYLTAGVREGIGGPAGSGAVIALPKGPGDTLGDPVACAEGLPLGVVHPTAEWADGRLYVIGGTRQSPVDEVWAAGIGADGCPLPFAAAAPLPEPRSHHASAVVDGRILILGGFGPGQAPRSDILASTHDADGLVDGWQVVGALDPAPWTAAAVVDGDRLWLVGGGEGSGFAADFVDTVRRAPLVDGVPGAFEAVVEPLPIARSHVHQTPLFDGRIYSVGGRVFQDDGVSMTSVERTFVGELLDR